MAASMSSLLTVLDQIDQQIENLRVDPNELRFTPQFAPRKVEDVVTEHEAQTEPPPMQGKIFKKIWKKNQWRIDDFSRRNGSHAET
jgi:hypothetical protein